MKILITQLARLGDIYLTWPTIYAILREQPEAEVHLLVRERYQQACEGLDPRIKIWSLPSRAILEPIYESGERVQDSLDQLEAFLSPLLDQEFQRVVNLSFSPFSSYLNHLFQQSGAEVRGYSRHSDGYLDIPDEGSAYFYAQVGIERNNRYHLVDLFAHVAGVTLSNVDFQSPEGDGSDLVPFNEYLCIHVGASEAKKAIPVVLVRQLARYLALERGLNVVLIGAPADSRIVNGFVKSEDWQGRLVNLVGDTTVLQASQILGNSYLIVGADSFPMHIGTLSSTPCVNLSSPSVNFWETGPLSYGSRIIYREDMQSHNLDDVVEAIDEALLGCEDSQFITVDSNALGSPRYQAPFSIADEFNWSLVQALYTGSNYPVLDDLHAYEGLLTLAKVSGVAIDLIPDLMNATTRKRALDLLSQIESTIVGIGNQISQLRPVVEWFQVEKIRLGPMPLEELAERTMATYAGLQFVCSKYVGDFNEDKESHP